MWPLALWCLINCLIDWYQNKLVTLPTFCTYACVSVCTYMQGGVIVINIEWHCNLDYSIESCLPHYSFSRLDHQDAKIAKGSNFRLLARLSYLRILTVCWYSWSLCMVYGRYCAFTHPVWPSVLWRCWLHGRKGIRPVKTEWWGTGEVICLEWGADLHMVQLMPMPLTVSCLSKIQIDFTFLVPAHPGSPGKRAVKRV